ncbi:MAG: hypothetical protein WA981_16270 [Glaciecola sp.]
MKTITSLLFASVLVITPISAVYAHQNADKHEMPMMKDQMMKKMQSHMEDMRAMLAAVKREIDPSKREAMLNEHAKKMEGMMGMMKSDDSKGMNNMKGMKHKHDDMSAEDKMAMMEKRMSIMEDMMEQMMGHAAEKSKPKHQHKKN